jgi:2-oxoglutarate dehydrogenase E1 component
MEGTNVRLAGQDARRGTFVQRHAVLHDRANGVAAAGEPVRQPGPLLRLRLAAQRVRGDGFEYGYSVERPDTLTLWEAQFGDFANGAQSVIDEYISAAEQKWGQQSSVVLLLPHGYEGQGRTTPPRASSATCSCARRTT